MLDFINKLIEEKFLEKNKVINNKADLAKRSLFSLIKKLNNNEKYLDYNFEKKFIRKRKDLINELNKINSKLNIFDRLIDKFIFKTNIKAKIHNIKRKVEDIDIKEQRENINKRFIENKKEELKDFFNDIEGRQLDKKQQEAILKNEINNLVVAGAGSGKTTTIVGKVKYLVEKLNYLPKQILVLSFTSKSAAEMKKRIQESINYNFDAMTFHKLGKEIISEVQNQKIKIRNQRIKDFVAEEIQNIMKKNKVFRKKYSKFVIDYFHEYKSKFEFDSLGEYINYLADKKLKTLQNERLKSMEEIEIANFLYLNNIKYEYERQYKPINQNYKPDFYLPEYNIYIEHFGIDRNNNVPSFFKGKNGKSAKEVYNEGIDWKRKTHKDNNTCLIETYSYEKFEGVLTSNLKMKLVKAGINLKPKSNKKVFNIVKNKKENEDKNTIKLFSNFIAYMRQNNISIKNVKDNISKIKSDYKKRRTKLFLELIEPILNNYENELDEKGEIDFSDMINKAISYVDNNQYNSSYKYIIIDEYQDISLNRLNLIKGLRNQTNAKVFCVGDDWQSIYRFTGSKVSLFTDFEEYMGHTEESKIDKTYRYNQRIVKLSSEFIQKNNFQIQKDVKSFTFQKEVDAKMKKIRNKSDYISTKKIREKAISKVLNVKKSINLVYGTGEEDLKKKLIKILDSLPHNAKVILLGRYGFDIDKYTGDNLKDKGDNIEYYDRIDLDIKFMSVHGSKGLEGEYVIIINNLNGKMGFPSQIEDDSVYEVLKTNNKEDYPYAEERRLFYVALTRTKNKVWLLVNENKKSVFIRELEKDYNYKKNDEKKSETCPKCNGELILKSKNSSLYLQCSDKSKCNYKDEDIDANEISLNKTCHVCGNQMEVREGRYGYFYGCKKYPRCNNTISI